MIKFLISLLMLTDSGQASSLSNDEKVRFYPARTVETGMASRYRQWKRGGRYFIMYQDLPGSSSLHLRRFYRKIIFRRAR